MMGALGTMAGKYAMGAGAKALGDTIGQFAGGKTAETIGGYNENSSVNLRDKAAKYNVSPEAYAKITADFSNEASERQQGRDMKMGAFANQLNQSNQRAGTVNQMALNDQSIAANQASQLATAYGDAASRQAQASAAMANAFMR